MANPKVKVLESYSGTFTDPAAGKEYTLALINQHSDINFAVAGATSAGVIDAAKSTKTFAIGVDSDQNYLAPGFVLTSMVKRVDTQAFDMIKSVDRWKFKGGKVVYYGLKEGGVAAAMDEYNKGLIAADVLKEVDELKAKVISGEIVVPNYFDLKPPAKRRWAHRRWRPRLPSRTRNERYDQKCSPPKSRRAASFCNAPRRRPRDRCMTPLVNMRNIVKMFGDFTAIHDASLEIQPGEVHALVGENGAGKSTLMNILYGLHSRTSGEIELRGAPVDFAGPAEAIAAGDRHGASALQTRAVVHRRREHHPRR